MQETLRSWCLWCVRLAAVAMVSGSGVMSRTVAAEVTEVEDSKECMVLDFSLESASSFLPNNLTVKPLSNWWHLKFLLSEGQAKPIACIRLEDGISWVDLSLFSGDCDNGKNVYLGSLSYPFKLQTWTTLNLYTTSDAVFLQEPQGRSVKLKGSGFTLPQNDLQMTLTEAWGVEAAVGCAVNCPVHYYAAAEPVMKTRVREWQHQSLYFHFRPGPSFSRLHYEVKCTTQPNKVFRREVEIKLGEEEAAGHWHLVELKQKQSNATVHLNGKMLEAIQRPESCVSSMHVIWTVGDGSFGFNCTPKGAEPTTEKKEWRDSKMHETQPGTLMHPLVAAGITSLAFVVVLGSVLLVWYIRKRRKNSENVNGERSSCISASYITESRTVVGRATGSSDSLLGPEMTNHLQHIQQHTEEELSSTLSTQEQARMTAEFVNKEKSTERKITQHSNKNRLHLPPQRRLLTEPPSFYSSMRDDENSNQSRVEFILQFENKAYIDPKERKPLIRPRKNYDHESISEEEDNVF